MYDSILNSANPVDRCIFCRAIKNYKEGKDLQGTQSAGRAKIEDLYDFSELFAEVRARANHLDAVTHEWFCDQVDAVRLKQDSKEDPSIKAVERLDKATYTRVLQDNKLKVSDTPLRRNGRRIISGTDFLNAANWASMLIAVFKAAGVSSANATATFSIPDSKSGLICNIDSTSLLLEFDENGVPKVVVPQETEKRLKDLGISVSVATETLKKSLGSRTLPSKTRSLQMHALTTASGTLLTLVFEISDFTIEDLDLYEVRLFFSF